MDRDKFINVVIRTLVYQLSQAGLPQAQYKIESIQDGPRTVSFNLAVSQSAIAKIEMVQSVSTLFRLQAAARAALQTSDLLPVRLAPGPSGTFALEVSKPRAMWLTVKASHLPSGKRLAVATGLDQQAQPVWLNFEQQPHLLVAGISGSGKTTQVKHILKSLVTQNDPDMARLILIDVKMAKDFAPFEHSAHLGAEIVYDSVEALKIVAWLEREMLSRAQEGRDKPHLFLVIDDAADLFDRMPQITEPLTRLCRSGRSQGIHVLLVLHNPTASNVKNRDITLNMEARICGKVKDSTASRVALGRERSGAEKLTGLGDMLILTQGDPRRFVGPELSAQDFDIPRRERLDPLWDDLSEPGTAMIGRPEDPLDMALLGRLLVDFARCRKRGERPPAPSTYGKALTPMVSAGKVERHYSAAVTIYRTILGRGHDLCSK